ncbi:MAG: DUF1080 domain-containing protein [Candidatus Cryptobacteroides sp.]
MSKKIFLLVSLTIISFGLNAQNVEWQDLFNGQNLDGWIQKGGCASFEVVDGTIVGTTKEGTPNSFLCTEKNYGNFILEFEFLADPALNCGVQFRSNFIDGLVRGYQYEIDPDRTKYDGTPANLDKNGKEIAKGKEPRSWTGGVYEEKLRGWIGDLTTNPEARSAFKPGKWNKARIEAVGDRICTWINGVQAVNLVDFTSPNGFIALQVHAVDTEKPLQIRYRNIRIADMGLNENEPDIVNPFIAEWYDSESGKYAKVFIDKETRGYKAMLFSEKFKNEEPLATIFCFKKSGENASFMAPDHWKGSIKNGVFTITHDGKPVFKGEKMHRVSPTLGMTAPEGAEVLFDGSSLENWYKLDPKIWVEGCGEASESARLAPGGRIELVPRPKLNGSIITKKNYSDLFLHAEFRTPEEKPLNGGIYFMGRYELNLKDTFGQGKGASCASFGNIAAPVHPEPAYNYALPPLVWQTLDVEFTAPRFDENGKKISNAKLTARLNGELIYENAEIEKLKGAAGKLGEAAEGPLYLQEHGTAYQFRNIWIIPLNNK